MEFNYFPYKPIKQILIACMETQFRENLEKCNRGEDLKLKSYCFNMKFRRRTIDAKAVYSSKTI